MSTNGASTSDAGAAPAARKESRKPKFGLKGNPRVEIEGSQCIKIQPYYSKFTQQELPACKPLLTPGWVIATFMVVGIIFIPIGAVCLLASNSVVEIVYGYEDHCVGNLTTKQDKVNYIWDRSTNKTCPVSLTVPDKMDAPVYIYYQLDNFYQNHRRYVKSRDDSQLRSDNFTGESSSDCKPEQDLNGNPIVPCGLIAWSLFNDTYTFQSGGQPLNVTRKGISWKSDRESKFGAVTPRNFPNNVNASQSHLIGGAALDPSLPLNQQEDLIVWMRTAALPTFRKLYGKIENDLVANQTINVVIQNNYNTYTFGGGKKLVLSTTSWLGGKNDFLGIAYLTVGILCIFLAFVFFLIHLKNPRPLGDPSYLSWNRKMPTVPNTSHN